MSGTTNRTFEALLVEREAAVVTVTLNCSETLNSITSQMLQEITSIYTQLRDDSTVRVIVLRGAGRAFCSGANRNDPPGVASPGSTQAAVMERAREGQRASEAIANSSAVTVAQLHGHVIGGGMVLAMNCDFRVGSVGSSFRLPEVALGIPLTWGMIPVLLEEVGAAAARELVMLAEPVSSARAVQLGILHAAAEPELLTEATSTWVERLLAMPPMALNMTKKQFQTERRVVDEEQADAEALMYAEAMALNWTST